MENEIDEDDLAAMLAEDDQHEPEEEEEKTKLNFAQQAETMTPDQLIQLTCSLIDEPAPTKKTSTYKLSDTDMGDLFGSKTSE